MNSVGDVGSLSYGIIKAVFEGKKTVFQGYIENVFYDVPGRLVNTVGEIDYDEKSNCSPDVRR